jgi:hypothetical protein
MGDREDPDNWSVLLDVGDITRTVDFVSPSGQWFVIVEKSDKASSSVLALP